MKSVSPFNIAAIVAAATVLTIAFILVPEPLWTATTIVTAIAFGGSVVFVFYIPSILRQKQMDSDAQQIAAIGPVGMISTLLLLAMGLAFAFALAGYEKVGLAILVFGIGAFLVSTLMLNAALKVVGDITATSAQPSRHVDWQSRVSVLTSHASHQQSLARLRALGEKLRYVASDVPGGSPQDIGIDQTFNSILAQLQSDPSADVTGHFSVIDSLLMQRDVYLRGARSQA